MGQIIGLRLLVAAAVAVSDKLTEATFEEDGLIAAAQREFHGERYNIMSSHSAKKNIRLIAHDAIQSSTCLCCLLI